VYVERTPVILGVEDSFANAAEAFRRNHEANSAEVYAVAAECRAHSSVEISASIEQGPIADALRGYAIRNGVDLIVMSSHRRGGLARVWLGSVADRLIRETGLPVLVVRPPSVATATTGRTDCTRILVPLDGSKLAEQSLPPALLLARSERSSITLLRVVRERDRIDDGVLQAARGRATARDVQRAERYLARIIAKFSERDVNLETKVVIASDIPGAIVGFTESRAFDLVAIATHGRSGVARMVYGSVADRVMRESVVSTLVIHPAIREKVPAEVATERRLLISAI
jgi:nucleotide-binding universal stress UspA family protein